MRLSQLQKYILGQSFETKNMLDRQVLLKFYNTGSKPASQEIMVNSITNSIERLITRGLLVGFGEFTRDKNFIHKIRLTRSGRLIARKFLGEQKRLPLKLKTQKSKVKTKA